MVKKIELKDLYFYYGQFEALRGINMVMEEKRITALIGPSGCGKTTLLKAINRMNDLIEETRIKGDVLLDERSIYRKEIDLVELRKKVGMVFQRPNPFPLSIFDNVAYGLRVHGLTNKARLFEVVERSLKAAWLWDEVKDQLQSSALTLSLHQQQRLCIARLLAIEPEVLLMDEPCSALDPLATLRIEELMRELRREYTIVIVTHNMQQAARVSDYAGFLLLGELVEFEQTEKLFTSPQDKRTEDYITGRFG